MNDFIDLQRLIVIILRRWWLLVAVTALAAILGYTVAQRQPRVYEATTTVLVGQIFQSTNLDRQDLLTSELVAQTYSDMARRQPVLQAAVDSLGLSQTWQELRRQVSVELVPDTQLIQITVEAELPLAAQKIADEVAHQVISFSPESSDAEASVDITLFVQQQLENLQARIEAGQSKQASLENELVRAKSAERLSELQAELSALESLITNWENTYTQLLGFLQTGQSPNSLTIIEPAQANPNPVSPQVQLIVLLAGGLGAFLALGLIFLLEYLDDTYKTPEEITREFGLPVIGLINETGEIEPDANATFVAHNPRSPIAEAYRSLRANLEFVGVDKPLKTILITSFSVGVGKSSVATNLALVMAQGEKIVRLVDADLRKSSIHRLAGLPNIAGLSDVFRKGLDISEVIQAWENENLGVITGGTTPPNPSELLGSKRMDKILASIAQKSDAVIIDSPPFVVSDALLLATKVDGVVLVIRPGLTRRKFARTMMEQLDRAGARVLGVVLNRIPSKGSEYYGEYQYYRAYYENSPYSSEQVEMVEEQQGNSRIRAIMKSINPFSAQSIKTRSKKRRNATIESKNGQKESSSDNEAEEEQETEGSVPNSAVTSILPNSDGMLIETGSDGPGNSGHVSGDNGVNDEENWMDSLPPQYRDAATGAFSDIPSLETLAEDLFVYRHWGGEAAETGSPLVSLKAYARPADARRYLSLPDYNSASNVTELVVPRGSTILRGKAASQSGNPGFGTYAVGGGEQVYLPDPNSAILIGLVKW